MPHASDYILNVTNWPAESTLMTDRTTVTADLMGSNAGSVLGRRSGAAKTGFLKCQSSKFGLVHGLIRSCPFQLGDWSFSVG
ncbi:hypothetical protein Fuma_00088 [Fuerstiella marisgermanici]|uniref:Uncharacterized protein n=1 Tax=Fuerstiella marisgermanici TaxID=1891926 RepID=A0A1P8W8Y8_9PLAN|nr:hypothetical protein Fuma_00088 [Fuerstiella marisgermanici]